MLNRDVLGSIPSPQVANAAMTVIDRLQDFTPEAQMLGLAAAFQLLADHNKVSAPELFAFSDRIVNGVSGYRPEFRAVAMYMENELT